MRVLLDTHTLVWATVSPKLLSVKSAEIISEKSTIVFVSAASAWEIATKVRIGKFPEARNLENNFLETMRIAGYHLLSIDAALALRAARLPGAHRDPFDRIIAAHALAEDIPIISADTRLDAFGIRRLW